jgi:hypothetical protein
MCAVQHFHLVNFVHVFGAVRSKGHYCEPLNLKLDGLPLFSRRSLAEELGFRALEQQGDIVDFLQYSEQSGGECGVLVLAGIEIYS